MDFDFDFDWDSIGGDWTGALDPSGGGFDWSTIGDWNGAFPNVDDDGLAMPNPNDPWTPTDPGLRGAPDFRNVFGGGGSGGGSSALSQLQRMLGMGGGGSGGGGSLAGLLPLLASIFGGVNARNATQDASQQMQRAAEEGNAMVRDTLGGASAQFKPYQDAGTAAIGQLSGMGPSNLASKYGALSGPQLNGGGNINPASLARPSAINAGSLAMPQSLAGNFRPLGAGRALSSLGKR
jgi:hypothetical protein